jgi:hypothetical protein
MVLWLPLAGEKQTEPLSATIFFGSHHVRFNMITQAVIKENFDYIDGYLYRIKKNSNNARMGKIDGHKTNGYLVAGLNGKQYLVHRLIFAWHKGYMPSQVDHIDGDILNNHIENLRPCTNAENTRNQSVKSRNRLGHKGVMLNKRKNKYIAQICCDYKRIHLGTFATLEEAKRAYAKASQELHGEYGRF